MGPAPFCAMSPVVIHAEVEQAPFESAIARCYLVILLIEHNLSQKFDLEAVAS